MMLVLNVTGKGSQDLKCRRKTTDRGGGTFAVVSSLGLVIMGWGQ